MSMTLGNKLLKDYTIDDLLLMCVRNDLPVLYSADERIMRMRCIMALKDILDQRIVTEHVVTRNITFRTGSKHRITGSMGMDYPTGIVEVTWVGLPDESIKASEDYRVLGTDTDPELEHAVWVAFKYAYVSSGAIDDYDLMYAPAELLAEHIACR